MDYLEKQNQLLARLRNMDELSRFDYLMHLAASQPEGDDELRRDENLFKACHSNLWIEILDKEGGLCKAATRWSCGRFWSCSCLHSPI